MIQATTTLTRTATVFYSVAYVHWRKMMTCLDVMRRMTLLVVPIVLFGCGAPGPFFSGDDPRRLYGGFDPDRFAFGAPSFGGLMLFASEGSYEIWRTGKYANLSQHQIEASGTLGSQFRIIGLGAGRRQTMILAQRDDGRLSLHRLRATEVNPTPIVLEEQPPPSGWKARSFALDVGSPRNCLTGDESYVILLERVTTGSSHYLVWIVKEDGRVTEQFEFENSLGNSWKAVAVGPGAVDSSRLWVLFAQENGREAKLVQTQSSAPESISNVEVPFVSPSGWLGGNDAASGFRFATSVWDGGFVYWWHIYKFQQAGSSERFVLNPVEGATGYPEDRNKAVVIWASPAGLELVAYADQRPACMSFKMLPYPPGLRRQQEYWEKELADSLREVSRPNLGSVQ